MSSTRGSLGTCNQEINHFIYDIIVREHFRSCKHLRNKIASISKVTADLPALSFLYVVSDNSPKPPTVFIGSSLSFIECKTFSSEPKDQSQKWIKQSARYAIYRLFRSNFNCVIYANFLQLAGFDSCLLELNQDFTAIHVFPKTMCSRP